MLPKVNLATTSVKDRIGNLGARFLWSILR